MNIRCNCQTWWIGLFCLGCALCAGCDRLVAMPEWDDWAAGETALIGGSQSADVTAVAPILDLSPSSSALPLDDSAFRRIRHEDPRAVVEAFLDAVKRADSRLLRRLMSHRCRTACDSMGLELTITQPSPFAECRAFHAEFLPDNREAAHVRCLWSDSQPTRDFVFVLRYETSPPSSSKPTGVKTAGWRIAGLAVPSSSGTEVFDLESSGDLRSLVVQ